VTGRTSWLFGSFSAGAAKILASAALLCHLQDMRLSMKLLPVAAAIFAGVFAMAPSAASRCGAQSLPGTFSLDRDRQPVVALSGLWRFHPGDNSAWADPRLDDSGWSLIRGDNTWNAQGFPNLDGFAWYRARVELPEGQHDVAIYIPKILTSYQVFADGKFLGGKGGMPPHAYPRSEFTPPAVYPLPKGSTGSARTVLIAIRVWHWPGWELLIGGGFYGAPLVGQNTLIQQREEAGTARLMLLTAESAALAMFEILAGIASLGFFWLRPREKEYLWFSIFVFASAALHLATRAEILHGIDVVLFDHVQIALLSAAQFAQVAFFYRLLGGRREWLFWMAIGSIAVNFLLSVSVLGLKLFVTLPHGTLVAWNAAGAVLSLAPAIWVLVLLVRRAVQGRFDARLLLAPVALLELSTIMDPVFWLGTFAFHWNQANWSWFRVFTRTPFPTSVPDLCEALFLAGLLAIFVHRFTRTSLQEDAHRRELESARIVQQVLIPEAIPRVPGFVIESVYKPAGEVGGDFFQILPSPEGGLLAVIGDVSGKGTPAAMTVSLLVGTVRTLAHFTQAPGEILAAMNQRMLGRSQGGFTTCLVLRIQEDGRVTMANAGHIAPFLNGCEVAVESGLPLGLAGEAEYPEMSFELVAAQQLTLVTDGVVEARGNEGELFGFERTAAASRQSAESIAETAQAFGQEDDITVLTLVREPALEMIRAHV
jgi:hypothetical protein